MGITAALPQPVMVTIEIDRLGVIENKFVWSHQMTTQVLNGLAVGSTATAAAAASTASRFIEHLDTGDKRAAFRVILGSPRQRPVRTSAGNFPSMSM
jgi:hypothetical protein